MSDSANPKTAQGLAKPSMHLIPSTSLIHLAVVMALGAKKYGPYNWREKDVPATVYLSAAERHLRTWLDGESDDPESGASHLAHAMACFAIVLDAMETGNLIDDRPTPAPTAELIRRLTTALPPLDQTSGRVVVEGGKIDTSEIKLRA